MTFRIFNNTTPDTQPALIIESGPRFKDGASLGALS
jgi:hypothetical protein